MSKFQEKLENYDQVASSLYDRADTIVKDVASGRIMHADIARHIAEVMYSVREETIAEQREVFARERRACLRGVSAAVEAAVDKYVYQVNNTK